ELQILRQSFLFEALGRNEFRPAAEMLKIYVPKNGHKMGDLARASAIWALGKIFRGSQDAGLANQLAQRMHDEDVMDPENELVRYNATLALGWIGAPSSLYQLRAVAYEPPVPLGLAREWAIQQCSGGSEN
ncbi:MAG: HEAT repeat domain-containing protein, partial [Planctomycetales bacterium]|nr:HEAT repeat domain-containing protein [Planctomycetales bacterium]